MRRTTGAAGEPEEARLLVVRGALVANARRASSSSVSFEIDDGSGPLRVFVAADSGIPAANLDAGAWIEVRGVLGQQTSGSQPLAGYRVWPRDATDLRLLAAAIDNPSTVGNGADGAATGGGTGDRDAGSLATLLAGGSTARQATVTLVTGHWEQLGLAGVVWDGALAVGVADAPAARNAIQDALADGAPVSVRIRGSSPGMQRALGLPLLRVAAEGDLSPLASRVAPPATAIPPTGGLVWARLTGFLRIGIGGPLIETASARVPLDVRCAASPLHQESGSLIQVEGLAIAGSPGRLVLACDQVAQAPKLAPGSAQAAGTMPAPAGDPQPRDAVASSDGRVPGALVLVGAAALLAAVCGWRAWERIVGGGDVAAGDPSADDMSEDDAEADPDEPAAALTLVSLPRERGSP